MYIDLYSFGMPKDKVTATLCHYHMAVKKMVFSLKKAQKKIKERPLVSCLTPTRNRKIVAFAIDCFQKQTYPHKEMIIVDSGDTKELEQYVVSLKDGRIKYVKIGLGDKELGDLRNICMSHAQGDFLCTWDDDDLYDPLYLEYNMLTLLNYKVSAVFMPFSIGCLLPDEKFFRQPKKTYERILFKRHDDFKYFNVKTLQDTVFKLFFMDYVHLDAEFLWLYMRHPQSDSLKTFYSKTYWQMMTKNIIDLPEQMYERMPVKLYIKVYQSLQNL